MATGRGLAGPAFPCGAARRTTFVAAFAASAGGFPPPFLHNLFRVFAVQFLIMVESGFERRGALRDRAQFNDEVLNARFGEHRLDAVPAAPACPCVEAENLAAPRRDDAMHLARKIGRAHV